MTATLAGYGHFLRLASRRRWDGSTIDFRRDATEWPDLDADLRVRVERLVAGFCVGESSVAAELAPFAAAAEDPDAAACFEIQALEERRHARFFDRWAAEVMGTPGTTPEQRTAALSERVPEEFLDLFERRLPAVAAELEAGKGPGLGSAVGLYHMVLEGVVFTAGQLTLADLLDEAGVLPGLAFGLDLVLRDEHWHVGFGARVLQDLGAAPEVAARVEREGLEAAGAWGDVVGPELVERVSLLHRRRLRAAGIDSAAALSFAPLVGSAA